MAWGPLPSRGGSRYRRPCTDRRLWTSARRPPAPTSYEWWGRTIYSKSPPKRRTPRSLRSFGNINKDAPYLLNETRATDKLLIGGTCLTAICKAAGREGKSQGEPRPLQKFGYLKMVENCSSTRRSRQEGGNLGHTQRTQKHARAQRTRRTGHEGALNWEATE